jgi:uncharacterized protein (DUF1697 family)
MLRRLSRIASPGSAFPGEDWMTTYVALLRGINVGGKNKIKMADLKACMEALGFQDVRTYIQSGNVIFRTGERSRARLIKQIEAALAETFGYDLPVVVRSAAEMQEIVAKAPRDFGSDPASYRYDAIFLKEPLTPTEAMSVVNTKEGVDRAYAGNGVLYFSRLISKATQSRLSRIVSTPIYQNITIRNWNTTTRLTNMMAEDGD